MATYVEMISNYIDSIDPKTVKLTDLASTVNSLFALEARGVLTAWDYVCKLGEKAYLALVSQTSSCGIQGGLVEWEKGRNLFPSVYAMDVIPPYFVLIDNMAKYGAVDSFIGAAKAADLVANNDGAVVHTENDLLKAAMSFKKRFEIAVSSARRKIKEEAAEYFRLTKAAGHAPDMVAVIKYCRNPNHIFTERGLDKIVNLVGTPAILRIPVNTVSEESK